MEDTTEHRGRSDPPAREALGGDLIIPLLAVALSSYYLLTTADLDWEAKSAGLFVGFVLLSLCALHFVRVVGRIAAGSAGIGLGGLVANTQNNRRRLALVLLTALFIVTIGWTGTTLGLFLLLLCSMLVMGVRDWRQLLGISIATSAVVYLLLIFLLNTRLPRGVVEKLIATALGQGE